ncbi:MAG: aminoacyl--tRNA ligase-related protein [bacterium]
MRQSQLFTKTIKEAPKDELSINAQLLIRGGFIDKLSAGIYNLLPLGTLVLKKIENIIREEMNTIGGQEILMPSLIQKELWETTGRWKVEEMFKLKSKQDKEYGLGWTHEEVITPLVQKFISSYKNFPVSVYQIQTKMRDETRAKSGILRGREFIMKDLYSFHTDTTDLDRYYETVKKAYFKIFNRCGLKKNSYLCLASGGTFSKFSHEFQTITPAGEDIIYICQKCGLAINREIKENFTVCPECGAQDYKEEKAIEIGNIFKLATKYTNPFNFEFTDKDGKKKMVVMGCYGIGLTRLIGTIAEVHHDEKGIIWPENVTPYKFHLLQLGNTPKVKKVAEKLYKDLSSEVLFDDRDKGPGEKFADCDLIGIPWRIVVSERTLEKDSVEIKKRDSQKSRLIKITRLAKTKF